MQTQRKANMKIASTILIIAITLISTQFYLSYFGAKNIGTTVEASYPTQQLVNSTITVLGNGEVTITPDRAILYIGITTQSSVLENASSKNAEIMNSIVSSLLSLGISKDDIRTVSYGVSPIYACCNSNEISGYTVTNQIQVIIRVQISNLTKLSYLTGQAIDASVRDGANQIYGIQFTVSQDKLKDAYLQALQNATRDALAQARAIASAVGRNITDIVSINTGYYYPAPMVFSSALQTNGTPIITPSSFTISASVTMTCRMG